MLGTHQRADQVAQTIRVGLVGSRHEQDSLLVFAILQATLRRRPGSALRRRPGESAATTEHLAPSLHAT